MPVKIGESGSSTPRGLVVLCGQTRMRNWGTAERMTRSVTPSATDIDRRVAMSWTMSTISPTTIAPSYKASPYRMPTRTRLECRCRSARPTQYALPAIWATLRPRIYATCIVKEIRADEGRAQLPRGGGAHVLPCCSSDQEARSSQEGGHLLAVQPSVQPSSISTSRDVRDRPGMPRACASTPPTCRPRNPRE